MEKKRSRIEHQSGCMRGLINIFDFRHGRPSQKLLADKKNGSRRITGAASTSQDLDTLDDSCEMCKIAKVGGPRETATSDKMSVKELMEEEMFKQDQIMKVNKTNKDSKQSVSNQDSHRRKNRWHTNKKSFDLSDLNIISENPTHQRHKSLSSLEVGEMMTELCTKINLKDTDCLLPPKEDPCVIKEKMEEATKVFVSHFVNGKNIKDVKFKPSRELIDALKILNSNKDVFLKLLQDPSSELVNHIQKLVDHQDEKSKVQVRPGEIEQEHGKGKHQSFFWRKFKGLDRNLSKKHDEHSQNASTIVILKPGSQFSEEHENKITSERVSTHLLFTEFTRKLKHAMRKEQVGLTNPEKAVGGEGLTMASPSRDHFFIEKIPRKPFGAKNRDKAGIKDEEHSLVSSPRSLFPRKESETDNQITAQQVQEEISHHSCSDKSELGKESRIVDDIEVKKSDIMEECNPHEGPVKSLHSASDTIHLEGFIEIIRPTDPELDKRISLNTFSETCSPSTSTNELDKETSTETMGKPTVCLNLDIVEENEAFSSLTSSPIPCSRIRQVEDSDAITDRSDWTSPISILEPICNEDDGSPRIKPMPVAELIRPRKINFEDQVSPSAPRFKTWEEERLSIFEFVKDVLQVSHLTQAQLLERFLFGECLLNPSLFDEVDFFLGCRYYEPNLIFDLIEEVLSEICERDFDGIPSFSKSYMSDLKEKDIVDEIWKGVNRHLEYEAVQSTLDHTVRKDLSFSSTWMELRHDCESIGIEVEEVIFAELMEDVILSCIMIHESGEVESSLVI